MELNSVLDVLLLSITLSCICVIWWKPMSLYQGLLLVNHMFFLNDIKGVGLLCNRCGVSSTSSLFIRTSSMDQSNYWVQLEFQFAKI